MTDDARKPHLITVRVGKTVQIGCDCISILSIEGQRVELCIRTDKHVRIGKAMPNCDNRDDDV